ncbi:MAG: GntG family PLP-dependent aldolase [Thermoanaerobaculia bacterium]|nr:GntG family PLP-dependent aldolase [Thermoanaerobaculia bacterium]
MRTIDLRSDTVTTPTPEMLEAMFAADVGDDVYGEDPTVNELEQKVAAMFGKDSAIYCPSGTMTNQIAIKLHTSPGDEVVCDRKAHVYNYEGGGIAFNSGCSILPLDGDRGRFTAAQVREAIRPPDDIHAPSTALVVVENTVNKGGGSIHSINSIHEIRAVCDQHGLTMHLDGARLFNALVETGEDPSDYGEIFETISICLSKGLGAPVGSILTGSDDQIRRARRIRKVLGGGMRQAGYLAAAGIYALDRNIPRLAEDHARARTIGEALERLDWVARVERVETNIVLFELADTLDPGRFLSNLEERGVRATSFGGQWIRFVTHLQFDDEMLDRVVELLPSLSASTEQLVR